MNDNKTHDFLQRVIGEKFSSNICCAFAYGSAFMKQAGCNPNQNVIDLILVVNDPVIFHQINLSKNYNDYSFVKYFGTSGSWLNKWFHCTSAGVYYNPFIFFDGRYIKYGVVSKEKLIQDLYQWAYLYLAGRLHKPVKWVVPASNDDSKISTGLNLNFENAIRAALLFLPDSFTEETFYRKICDLSYNGDIRTWFNIDRSKSKKIVNNNFEQFQKLYHPFFEKFSHVFHFSNGKFLQDNSNQQVTNLFNGLPSSIQLAVNRLILPKIGSPGNLQRNSNMVLESTNKVIWKTVCRSSIYQTFKGLPTAVSFFFAFLTI
ncbi:hypothetical protein HZS_2868 [Henneguya salminicola]|nr:hypothetical protein HZS_2868 [Henneguya salminicola]